MTKVAAIVGPTASGKSAVALALAAPGTEIVSVDSMQVYRGMDIGTAKPSAADRAAVPHHMVDLVDPSEPFSVAEFQLLGRRALDGIDGAALIVGGSGLHFRALVDPLEFPPTDDQLRAELDELDDVELRSRLLAADPEAAATVELGNRRRVVRALEILELAGVTPTQRAEFPAAKEVAAYVPARAVTIVGFDPGAELEARIVARCDAMMAAGWLDEVAALRGRLGPTAASAVGYRELTDVIEGRATLSEARADIIGATRRLAKRQRTYFRRDPRIRWLPWRADLEDRVADAAAALEEASWSS